MKTYICTCTTMVFCDGATGEHVYHVMRGPLRGKCFYSERAEHVATYSLDRDQRPDYRAMTAKHATPEAPAVFWQT